MLIKSKKTFRIENVGSLPLLNGAACSQLSLLLLTLVSGEKRSRAAV